MKNPNVYNAYQQWSNSYDSQINPTRDLSAALVRHLSPQLAGCVVVEAGCGTGINTTWLVAQGATVTGIDLSDAMLDVARGKPSLSGVALLQHDVLQPWPAVENSADYVLINLVLEHIDDIETVIGNALAIMKPGARLLITEYHPDRVALGKGAEFTNPETGAVEIINFHHPIDEYAAIAERYSCRAPVIRHWCELKPGDTVPVENGERPLILSIELVKG